MALTVGGLVELPGLQVRVVAGRSGLGREVRWAHVTELADPVPWLRGGELVLTVGLGIGASEHEQREYVHRLFDAGCAGLGFALDTWIERIPPVVPRVAEELGFPLLQVEGETPFIAVVEAVADHHARARLREQQRVLTAQDAMVRAALRAGFRGVLHELAGATEGDAVLLDPNGMIRETSAQAERPWHAAVRTAATSGARPHGMTVFQDGDAAVLMQSLGMSGNALGWLALRCASPVSSHTRVLANHAASLLAVDLQRSRAARRERNRGRARSLALLLDDAAPAHLAEHAPALLALPAAPYEVAAYPARRPEDLLDPAADAVHDLMGDTAAAERTAVCAVPGALVAVLPEFAEARPRLGERLLEALRGAAHGPDRAGACAARDAAELRTAALRAQRAAAVGPGYHHADDVDAWSLLRRSIPRAAAEEFTTRVLGRLREHDERNGSALLVSLRRYLERDANIEAAARDLGVHRNTLRTRLRAAERVSGTPLTARHRMELALALSLDEGY
ncbi:purine catabolism regulator [Spinactinospora alkalitolerans]|uniref:Purine catabolism regulator n=1 Tax=Spinactinospora alkalitolerans TaxID=687207 RepID=A0A852U8N8_9ACTN|nr:PucR family transcriptional regulator ligand-binding domain-containing protein [Spinactinospora alkalitolerans]NYE50290.1 purine catabolism regulator [Spinactinospora alkalitolerans]